MSGIGAALREARSRARIEIAQVEAQTKIRAKYLRALENEEWDLLPGPTYVKSFLRTYGDVLGLDGRGLVADYKRSEERAPVNEDFSGFAVAGRSRQPAPSNGRGLIRLVGVLLVAAVIGGAVYLFTQDTGAKRGSTKAGSTPARSTPSTTTPVEAVAVQLAASRPVRVCTRAGKQGAVVRRDLKAGQRTASVRSRALLVTLSGPGATLRVNGVARPLPGPANRAQSFTVTATGVVPAAATVTACRH